jgi:hypothetical protein
MRMGLVLYVPEFAETTKRSFTVLISMYFVCHYSYASSVSKSSFCTSASLSSIAFPPPLQVPHQVESDDALLAARCMDINHIDAAIVLLDLEHTANTNATNRCQHNFVEVRMCNDGHLFLSLLACYSP